MGKFLIWITLAAFILFSPLGFLPIPWPDSSAFYLPGLDLIAWPPRWIMRTIEIFEPMYGIANFQTMPGMSIVFGIWAKLGLSSIYSPEWGTRFVSMAVLVWIAASVSSRIKSKTLWAILAGVLVLTHPMLRWGTLVVRTEVILALFWWKILNEFERESPSPRRLGLYLGASALFHFNAIAFVLPVALGLKTQANPKEWLNRLIKCSGYCLLIMSPWILFTLLNLDLFIKEMTIQFHRLDHVQKPVRDFYTLFHGLFPSLGHPLGWPKSINVLKGLTLISVALLLHRRLIGSNVMKVSFAGIVCTGLLFQSKPEVWFVTLFHFSLVFSVIKAIEHHSKFFVSRAMLVGLTAASLMVMVVDYSKLKNAFAESLNWGTYKDFVKCVDQSIPSTAATVWQPFAPEVLVELSYARPSLKLTRALDIGKTNDEITAIIASMDVMLLSTIAYGKDLPSYRGPARPEDEKRAQNGNQVPMGPQTLSFKERRLFACEQGPFWALLSIR